MKYLVFDVGGSAIKYSIMTEEAEFIITGKLKTPTDSFDAFRETIGSIYDEYKDDIQGIAMSMPGIIDSDNGYAYTGGFLRYNDKREIVKELQERCHCNIVIENDGKAAALAEVWKGSLKENNDGIVIILGTGVGGGIIKDRKVHRGKHFMAGEFSYIQSNISDPYNMNGFLGVVGSAIGMVSQIAESKGLKSDELDGIQAFEYIKNNDSDAVEIIDKYTKNLAVQIYNLQCLFDPEKICIGGGISAQDILIDYIIKNVKSYYRNLNLGLPEPEVVRCKFGNDSNQIGALYKMLSQKELVTN